MKWRRYDMEEKTKGKKRGMSREEAMNIYSDLQQSVINVLKRDLPENEEGPVLKPKPQDSWLRGMLGVIGVLALARGTLAGLGLIGILEISPAHARSALPPPVTMVGAETRAQRELFDDLERARAMLEKRRVQFEDKERELELKEEKLAVRLAELRQLTAELRTKRKANQAERDSQLEQLANVYVSMKPNEAARLLQELDTMIALDLIKNMPEKRIGQLLSLMDPEKALVMTRMLTGTLDSH